MWESYLYCGVVFTADYSEEYREIQTSIIQALYRISSKLAAKHEYRDYGYAINRSQEKSYLMPKFFPEYSSFFFPDMAYSRRAQWYGYAFD